MSAFSDKDIRDWKDRLNPDGIRPVISLSIAKQRALLARLEAAEALALHDQEEEGHCDLQEAWRKSKGL